MPRIGSEPMGIKSRIRSAFLDLDFSGTKDCALLHSKMNLQLREEGRGCELVGEEMATLVGNGVSRRREHTKTLSVLNGGRLL
jgi:hypothetical protein